MGDFNICREVIVATLVSSVIDHKKIASNAKKTSRAATADWNVFTGASNPDVARFNVGSGLQ
jgi:hypothetical protein